MNDQPANLRSVIDEIALQVADCNDSDNLQTLIADRTLEYVINLREQQSWLTEAEADRIAEAIVKGALKRLAQIAEGGGQIGTG